MSLRKKQLSFDLDTEICKKIFGENRYTQAYKDIRSFLEKNDCSHIEGSVYMSNHGMNNVRVSRLLEDLLSKHPYLSKCIREIHQADISNVHSLNQYFSYDGTPGQYEQAQDKSDRQKREPPKRPSVHKQLEKNKAAIEEKEKDLNLRERASPHHKRDDLLR